MSSALMNYYSWRGRCIVDCEPVEVRDQIEDTEQIEGTGESDRVKGVGDIEWSKAP